MFERGQARTDNETKGKEGKGKGKKSFTTEWKFLVKVSDENDQDSFL